MVNQSAEHEYNISVSGDNTIQYNEDGRIVATVTDEDDNPVNDMMVDFYTEALDLQTDENGVCVFTNRIGILYLTNSLNILL